MGRHQLRLLLCSIAALALLIAALFGTSWFTASMGYGPTIELDLRHTKLCQDGICTIIPLGKLRGIYPVTAAIAFWSSLPVLLLVLVQGGLRLLGGAANASLTRIGYLLAFLALVCGFASGFLVGPESKSIGDMAGIEVERTIAPALFAIGALLAMMALRLASTEGTSSDDATYKPVVVRKDLQSDRLPVTPLTGVKKVPSQPLPATRPSSPPAKAALPDSLPFDSSYSAAPDIDLSPAAPRTKAPTGQPLEVSIRTSPTKPPIEPIEIVRKPDPRPRMPSSAPLSESDLVGVDQRVRTIDLPARARSSSSGPVDVAARLSAAAAEAAAQISVKPPLPVAEPTPPDEIAVAPESGLRIRKRTPTGGNVPLTREEPPPSIAPPEVGLHFRKKPTTIAPPVAEPLPASAFAPPPETDVSLRTKSPSLAGQPMPTITADGLADVLATQPPPTATPPLGTRQTLPPPVAKSATVPPPVTTAPTIPPPVTTAPTIPPPVSTAPTIPPPVTTAPTIPPPVTMSPTMSPTMPPSVARTKSATIPPSVARTKSASIPPLATTRSATTPPLIASAKTTTIPPATIAGARSQTVPPPVASDKHKTLPPPMASVLPAPASASGSGSMPVQPAVSRALTPRSQGSGVVPMAADAAMQPGSIAEAARAHADSQPPATKRAASASTPPMGSGRSAGSYSQHLPRTRVSEVARTDEWRPLDKPAELPEQVRGVIHYAVLTAELSGAGIQAHREDGMTKLVAWGDIVGIVARRFPAGPPHDGATFVDLVSTAGATLRIVPWTQIKGHTFAESMVARARELVNIVAAQSLDAKLDAPTRLFADSEGQASQLPDAAALAAHDQKLA